MTLYRPGSSVRRGRRERPGAFLSTCHAGRACTGADIHASGRFRTAYRAPADLRTMISEESSDDHVDIIAADRGTAGTISARAIRTLTTAGQVVLSCGAAARTSSPPQPQDLAIFRDRHRRAARPVVASATRGARADCRDDEQTRRWSRRALRWSPKRGPVRSGAGGGTRYRVRGRPGSAPCITAEAISAGVRPRPRRGRAGLGKTSARPSHRGPAVHASALVNARSRNLHRDARDSRSLAVQVRRFR
jgi:hypothetical protein